TIASPGVERNCSTTSSNVMPIIRSRTSYDFLHHATDVVSRFIASDPAIHHFPSLTTRPVLEARSFTQRRYLRGIVVARPCHCMVDREIVVPRFVLGQDVAKFIVGE